jgi:hypothetical protein
METVYSVSLYNLLMMEREYRKLGKWLAINGGVYVEIPAEGIRETVHVQLKLYNLYLQRFSVGGGLDVASGHTITKVTELRKFIESTIEGEARKQHKAKTA